MKILLLVLITIFQLNASNFYYEFGKKIEVSPVISSKSLNNSNNDFLEYSRSDGKIVKFKNEIIMQCNKNTDCEDDLIDLSITDYKKIGKTFFVIKVSDTQNIFELCQTLYKKTDIKSAHPNYVRAREKR